MNKVVESHEVIKKRLAGTPVFKGWWVLKRSINRYIKACPTSPYLGEARQLVAKLDTNFGWYVTHNNLLDASYPYQWAFLLDLP